jgi:chaperone required for assembly of F1-ATPase
MSDPFGPGRPPGDDPVRRAQALTRPELPRRFYAEASVLPSAGGFAVALDGRPTHTPSKAPVVVPTAAIAAALAGEWNAQGELIDPATMPLSRLVNAAIDAVGAAREAVADTIVAYAGSDLLCYRPDGPDGLLARIAAHWDPVVRWAEARFQAHLVLAEGLMPVEQSPALIAAVRAAVPLEPPLLLAAVQALTTLTGSALLALAVAEGRLSIDEAWAAAHVDEDWNISLWGADAEAAVRRAAREREARAAAFVIADLTTARREPG